MSSASREPRPSRAPALALLVALLMLLGGSAVAANDRDGDGLRDAWERKHGLTSSARADSDGDGVIDAAEDADGDELAALGEQRFGTDPANADSDGDGRPDGREDSDGDGSPDAVDQHRRPVPAGLRPSLATAAEDIAEQAPGCGVRTGSDRVNVCRFGVGGGEHTVVLMGDSKATMYLPPLITVAKAEGWRLRTLLKGRCPPVLGTMVRYQKQFDDGDSCRRWRNAALAWLREARPELVVVTFSDDYVLVDSADRKLDDERRARALVQGLTRTLEAMPAGTEVVLLADAPKSTRNPARCLATNTRDMSACLTLRPPAAAQQLDEVLRDAVTAAGGTYRTLEERICPTRPCPLVQGDTLIYRDKGHLTVTFTERLAPSLRAELAPLLPPPTVEPAASPAPSPVPSPQMSPDPSSGPSTGAPFPSASAEAA